MIFHKPVLVVIQMLLKRKNACHSLSVLLFGLFTPFFQQQLVMIRTFPHQFGPAIGATLFLTGNAPLMRRPIIAFGTNAIAASPHGLISRNTHFAILPKCSNRQL
jgi:hypothetical protein